MQEFFKKIIENKTSKPSSLTEIEIAQVQKRIDQLQDLYLGQRKDNKKNEQQDIIAHGKRQSE